MTSREPWATSLVWPWREASGLLGGSPGRHPAPLQDLHAAVASPAQLGIAFKRRHLSLDGHGGGGGGGTKSWAWARTQGCHAGCATPPGKGAIQAEGHRQPKNKTPANSLRDNRLRNGVSASPFSVVRRTTFCSSHTNTCAHGGAREVERKAALGALDWSCQIYGRDYTLRLPMYIAFCSPQLKLKSLK